MNFKFPLLGLAALFATATHADERPLIHLTSLEWPPYTGEKLPDQGTNSQAVVEAFKRAGYQVSIDFLPWNEAVERARTPDSKYAGYFPEYYSSLVEHDFIFSDVIGHGPLGFAERTAAPIEWNTLDDLKNHRIGVVQDYVNTAEFDAMAAHGDLHVEPVVSDLVNIKKLANNRLDLAVIDQHVLEFLMQTEPSLKAWQGKLQFNKHQLENKGLYLCFRRQGANQAMIDAVNRELHKAAQESTPAKP